MDSVKDAFAGYHPVVNLTFFIAMIISTMLFFDVIYISLSFLAALSYGFYVGRKKFLKTAVIFVLPAMVISVLINVWINNQGTTVVFYLFEKPIYLEVVLYAALQSLAFASVLMWCYTYNFVMSSDKFIYVFGRIIPTLSLVFSMVLRFIPMFHSRASLIGKGQKCIGHDTGSGSKKERISRGISILSIMTTWSLENSVDTSDSMKARGYGLPGRTAYNQYYFSFKDITVMIAFVILLLIVFFGIPNFGVQITYFPTIDLEFKSSAWVLVYICGGIFGLFPIILNLYENIKWKYLEWKIQA